MKRELSRLKRKKDKLESKMGSLLTSFTEKTGLDITDIKFDKFSTMGGFDSYEVKVNIEL